MNSYTRRGDYFWPDTPEVLRNRLIQEAAPPNRSASLMAVSVMRRIVSLETDARRSPKCAEISSVVSLLAYNEKQELTATGLM